MDDKYKNWHKYNLAIKPLENGLAITGDPQYPNGHLLGTILGHMPMKLNGNQISFTKELEIIKRIEMRAQPNERYPLVDECGQICIYKNESYLYDTLIGEAVIEDFETLMGDQDEKDVKPIMVIPTKDMIGLLEDNIKYHQENNWKLKFSGSLLRTRIQDVKSALESIYSKEVNIRTRIFGEEIILKELDYEIYISSLLDEKLLNKYDLDDFDFSLEFNCKNKRRQEIIYELRDNLERENIAFDFEFWHEKNRQFMTDEIVLKSKNFDETIETYK